MNSPKSFSGHRRAVSRAAAELNLSGRVSHHGRAPFKRLLPLLASWQVRQDVGSVRGKKLLRQVMQALRGYHRKAGFRVTHVAVHGAEVSMIVEADTALRLSRGMQGLGVSMARRLNRSARRRGAAFDDRFRAQPLANPAEVARAIERLRLKPLEYRSEALPRVAGALLVARPRTGPKRVERTRAALPLGRGAARRPRWWWPTETASWLRQLLRS